MSDRKSVEGATMPAFEDSQSIGLRSSLDDLYLLKEPHQVRKFLEEHPHLALLLDEAHSHIREHFPTSPILLEVVADPEDVQNSQLVAYITTNYDPAEAFAQLQA